jgi:hypothetical protein
MFGSGCIHREECSHVHPHKYQSVFCSTFWWIIFTLWIKSSLYAFICRWNLVSFCFCLLCDALNICVQGFAWMPFASFAGHIAGEYHFALPSYFIPQLLELVIQGDRANQKPNSCRTSRPGRTQVVTWLGTCEMLEPS